MPEPIKQQYMHTKTGNYIINFYDSDKNKSNYERIEIIKCDKDFKNGRAYNFTGMDLIIESCPIAGRENWKTVFAKDGSGKDNKSVEIEHNRVYLKSQELQKYDDNYVDDKQLAQYLNGSFKESDNNTKFKDDYYISMQGTGTVSEIKNTDGKMSYKYTSTLFTERPRPKAKLISSGNDESGWTNAEF